VNGRKGKKGDRGGVKGWSRKERPGDHINLEFCKPATPNSTKR
jgi:hypothetical protein